MRPLAAPIDTSRAGGAVPAAAAAAIGTVIGLRDPQALFANESLGESLRRLELHGRDGLPVLSVDGMHVLGWVTGEGVVRAVAREIEGGTGGHGPAGEGPDHDRDAPLVGYCIAEIVVDHGSAADGHTLAEVDWPRGHHPVSVRRDDRLSDVVGATRLQAGDRVNVLVPRAHDGRQSGAPDRDVVGS